MKVRSKSVPKIVNRDLVSANPSKLQELHVRVSGKVYGEKFCRVGSNLHLPKVFSMLNEKPPVIHTHTVKSYEKLSQSSPSTRIKKLKEARMFNNHKVLGLNSKYSALTSKEVSLSRQERSHELITQASQLLLKEKENTNNIVKASKDFSGFIRYRIKNINKKFEKIGLSDLKIIEDISNKYTYKKRFSKVLTKT
jgi:hypothetical protein